MVELGTKMRIGGVTDMSTVDWYGNVSLVLFWAGCNIKCPYCHNSTLIPLDSGTEVNLYYLDDRLNQGMTPVPSLDSVVFTGGEPLLQPDAVIEAAKLVKQYDLKLMLDTNGTIYKALETVLKTGLFDRVALDVKSPLNQDAFGKLSQVPEMAKQHIESVKKTLILCKELGIPVEARTTIAPKLSDSEKYIRKIAQGIKGYFDVYYLQQFDNQGEVLDPILKEKNPPTKKHMIKLAKAAIDKGVEPVYIKTRFDGLERIK
ncbi:anaerobic ribonucleoside-triphosphate reductase activating protein [Thermoproteota archaeon]